MSLIQNIKQKLSDRIIKGKLNKNPRKKEFHNLDSAKNIGILFDTLDDKNYPIVKKFSEDLSKKGYKVQTIGWINANELPDFGVAQKIIFYTNKDVKWTGEPLADEIKDFMNKRFDLLFILSDSDHISFRYLAELSNAACKVGAVSEQSDRLDLMIDQGKNKSVDHLIKESLNYLSLIKKH
ncbi:DUF6913 domain-containing protein [Marinifilum caeruleilacunae]|uniref:NYN domain-containing protein n=1 Tax=Marinifilum caeruleilacunae TaxID=2499076 RepID=A0ABX1WRU6_9BACT|nr:hypothetical protein [Marinifilum caeruleilacunae]NOU58654.1 hypothetical protein [Marinifilum caeruleilacunae]